MERESWIVTKGYERPAGRPGECFYCQSPVGEEHKVGCVGRSRTVVLRWSVEFLIDVPEDWTEEQICFFRQGNSHCSSNTIDDLQAIVDRWEKKHGEGSGCLCSESETEFVREATEDDHERYAFDWAQTEEG